MSTVSELAKLAHRVTRAEQEARVQKIAAALEDAGAQPASGWGVTMEDIAWSLYFAAPFDSPVLGTGRVNDHESQSEVPLTISTTSLDVSDQKNPRIVGILNRIALALENSVGVNSTETPTAQIAAIIPEYLSKEDAAMFLGVPAKTIEYLIDTRKLRYVQVGSQRRRVIAVEALRRFAHENTMKTAGEMLAGRKKR